MTKLTEAQLDELRDLLAEARDLEDKALERKIRTAFRRDLAAAKGA